MRAIPKIKQSDHIYAIKIRTESNGLGVLKTLTVFLLIVLQMAALLTSYLYFFYIFQWYALLSIAITLGTCIHCLSSDYHGQAKATWVFFLLICFSFGYIFYFMSDKRILMHKTNKKYSKIMQTTAKLQNKADLTKVSSTEMRNNCEYLYSVGKFAAHTSSKTTFYPSGTKLYDAILDDIRTANDYIFMEYFIISDGVLLSRFLDILIDKAKSGVDVRIIYDDMGSHKTLKRRTKKLMRAAGIKLVTFNRLVPIINIALNLRDHRKIVCIDGRIAYTGGANLADEYINEKRMHGYWKDTGIKVVGSAVDNLTIAFLTQWQFITNENINYKHFIGKAEECKSDGVVVPFVSGPNYPHSIAQNMYANEISNAKEILYIMTPYFIPDETITNLLINKAKSCVDVRIILPDVADKKFVYIVSRNNAEKLMEYGIKIYTMTHSFVHSKIVLTENSAIVGSINMDLRSFNQQFESAILTNEKSTIEDITKDFVNTINHCELITSKNRKRNRVLYRILAGLFKLISPFM